MESTGINKTWALPSTYSSPGEEIDATNQTRSRMRRVHRLIKQKLMVPEAAAALHVLAL